MRKTLVISWGLPPGLAGSSVILYNLAYQFSRDEMVLAGQDPDAGLPLPWGPEKPPIHHIARALPRGWRGDKPWRMIQIPFMVKRGLDLVRRERCGNVIGVFPDEFFLFAAYVVARRSQTHFFPYFHNTYLENRNGWKRQFAEWLQPRVFNSAHHVFVMSEGMRELYRKSYPALRCSALPHTFNEPLPQSPQYVGAGNPLLLGFAGNVNESCADAARRMFRAAGSTEAVRLRVFSGLSPDHLACYGIRGSQCELRSVPRSEIVRELNQCDVLLLPHGFTGRLARVEYETIFPTKTIEYLISGRPILAHTPPGVFLTRFLKEHDCALVVEEPSETALVAAINRLRTDADLRLRLVSNALKTARMFQASEVAKHLRRILDSTEE